MKGEYFRLNRESGLLVTQQLYYQRQIESVARAGCSSGDLRYQFIAQRTKIGAAERHRRKLGESDPVRAQCFGDSDPLLEVRLHLPPLPARQTARRYRRERATGRHD